ncbi:peptide deformylase [Brevibacillus reuszeri]|uniref:Peptide deformylase n=1 Tax=Brevibacillus reuszeri TaxID=54915 RepID=A0A0K9YXS6_9BACL|nr:peptide deformylase [Brevibacillus reuszeri]KNB73509.1 peptide deformylase [Brevibacillus reuszeri]MED1858698.1 peptide deformylase [Brevibacillus reuszeri]GED69678.1 peptide deformylase [Brevibacillus reuszeri]
MAEKTIVPFGDPILRKVAKPVVDFNDRLAKLVDDMVDTLYAAEGRAGLAAPQIGILKRVVVMDCGDGLIELINPEILESYGEQIGPEACLSLPGYTGIVKRTNYVKIKSSTRTGDSFILEAEEYLARCIQHEIDHLDGILYVDRIEGTSFYHDRSKRKANLLEVLRLTNQNV